MPPFAEHLNLPWYESDGLMSYIDSLKCQEFLNDTDEHYKKAEVINFNIIHHRCRGDPLQNAIAPIRATEGSVGYDLYAAKKCSILPQSKGLVPTDIALQSPKNVYSRIAPRSNVAMKNTDVGAGVIDTDYRGNVRVLILNHSAETFNIEAKELYSSVCFDKI